MIKEIAISRAEARFPQIRGKVEVADVATPITFRNYSANREGSILGWKITPVMRWKMMKGLSQRPTRIPNLLMVGQWTTVGGGIPPCLMSGERVVGLVDKLMASN